MKKWTLLALSALALAACQDKQGNNQSDQSGSHQVESHQHQNSQKNHQSGSQDFAQTSKEAEDQQVIESNTEDVNSDGADSSNSSKPSESSVTSTSTDPDLTYGVPFENLGEPTSFAYSGSDAAQQVDIYLNEEKAVLTQDGQVQEFKISMEYVDTKEITVLDAATKENKTVKVTSQISLTDSSSGEATIILPQSLYIYYNNSGDVSLASPLVEGGQHYVEYSIQ